VEISVATTIKNIIFKTGDLETQILQMERYGYLRGSQFCFIVMSFDNEKDENQEFNMNKAKIYAERIARSIHELYISFSYNKCRVLVLVNYGTYDIDNFVNTFYKNWKEPSWAVHMGISENKAGINLQPENFNNAFTAMTMSRKKNEEVIFYDKLDIYKLLLNTKDKEVLKEYYADALGKLEKYDIENKTDFNELFTYVSNK